VSIEHFAATRGNTAAGFPVEAPELVAIAFSAGGLQPLRCILHNLPIEFAAAVVVVHHVIQATQLPAIIQNSTRKNVQLLNDGDALFGGRVYVAPPNRHVFVRPDRTVGLSTAPRVQFVRPSADWLFESAASVFGQSCTAVVLSGRLCDGARGVTWVRRSAGQVIAQTPSTCDYPSMPSAAINTQCVDLVLDPDAIGPALRRIVSESNSAALVHEWRAPFAMTDH